MKIQLNKQTAIALILILAIPMTLATFIPTAHALEIPTFALLNVAPNPVGVNQVVYVNAFMSKPTPTAGMGTTGDQYEDITVKITTPSGKTETIGPLRSDSTGGTWASYTPTEIGSYKLQMFYPGGVLQGGGSMFGGGGFNWTGSILLPSESVVVTLEVQEAPIESIYQTPPLPTEYWSRPIYATNWAWAQLGGSWFGLRAPAFATTGQYDAQGNVQLYTTAPNTGHIVWTKPTHFGGQVGLPISGDQMSQYTSTSIAINHFEPVVLNGILYYTKFASSNSKIYGWEAVDLRTGETLWSRSPGETGNEVIRMGQILRFHTIQEYGSQAYLWSCEVAGFFQQPTFFGLYDAMTGEWLANVTTDIQNGPFLMDFDSEQQGTLLAYYTSGGNLTMWNSTRCFTGSAGSSITVRYSGNREWSRGVQWTVPIPTTTMDGKTISPSMSIAARTPDVILLRSAPSPGTFQEMSYGSQVTAGINAKTGALLWGPVNQTLPYLNDMALLAARDDVYVVHNKDKDEAYGYSLRWGNQLWGPVKLPGNAWSSIARAAEIAYDKVFIWDFGGYVNALDAETGEILWTFEPRSSGYDAPYGIYPLWHFGTHSICDGKLFFSEGSMYNPPLHPAYRLAIDCESGELVWSILSYSGRAPAAHADGYMVEWNSFDAQIYTFGKGQTITTASIQNDVVSDGSSVLIKGMVTDASPGTKDPDRVARFPHGVPAVSDANMSDWMEYVYMQQIKPTDVVGIEVKLTATDENGESYDLGSTTSDIDGMYSILWTPPKEGMYKIVATFEGSESYWPSHATVPLAVTQAPAASPTIPPQTTQPPSTAPPTTQAPTESPTTPPQTAEPPETSTPTETYIIAAVAAVIIIVAAAAALLLRRRK